MAFLVVEQRILTLIAVGWKRLFFLSLKGCSGSEANLTAPLLRSKFDCTFTALPSCGTFKMSISSRKFTSSMSCSRQKLLRTLGFLPLLARRISDASI
jgi:hypothetical protein